MYNTILLFIFGLLLLIKGGDWFVDGATAIAKRFKIPDLLIGATVVSIGTTLPEVMVSGMAALEGSGSIAYGNAIGSIICNTALIAAITIAVAPGAIHRRSLRMPVTFFFTAAAFYVTISYTTGYFYRWVGIALLGIFVVYMILSILQMRKKEPEFEVDLDYLDDDQDGIDEIPPLWKSILMLVIGAAVIAVGADLLVDNGILIAQALGVPETVIGLTFVSLGTSLPELVTAITALLKKHGSLSLGNVIGANLFNLILVSGVSVTLSPFPVPQAAQLFGQNASLVLDLPLMLGVMLILTVPALIRGKLARWQGISLLAVYAAFCTVQFVAF
ncbi:MAG: calcium/sodium antiporter [Ruminococcaceae bacterium]|nr:calcium/sodium antiporter [Oscillospiraceae bacterium]